MLINDQGDENAHKHEAHDDGEAGYLSNGAIVSKTIFENMSQSSKSIQCLLADPNCVPCSGRES